MGAQEHAISVEAHSCLVIRSAFDLLHYKNVDMSRLAPLVPGLEDTPPKIIERLNIEGLYKQHVIRQVSLSR